MDWRKIVGNEKLRMDFEWDFDNLHGHLLKAITALDSLKKIDPVFDRMERTIRSMVEYLDKLEKDYERFKREQHAPKLYELYRKYAR